MIEDPKQRIGRPRQLYLGKAPRKYQEVNTRQDWHASLAKEVNEAHGKGHLHAHEEFIDKTEPPSSPQVSPRASMTKLDNLHSISETDELTTLSVNSTGSQEKVVEKDID